MAIDSIRSEIVAALKAELVGPSPGLPYIQINKEEVLATEDPPRLRYGAGILFPLKAPITEHEEGEHSDTDSLDLPESESADSDSDQGYVATSTGESHPLSDIRGDTQVENDLEVNRSNEFLPSAMGITALVEVPEKLSVQISTAQYQAMHSDDASYKTKDGKVIKRNDWHRTPVDQTIEITDKELLRKTHTIIRRKLETSNKNSELCAHIYCRPAPATADPSSSRTRFITITLINRTASDRQPRDEDCFFQCQISTQSADNTVCFYPYPEKPLEENSSEEDKSLALLYRHKNVFAVGHGCAADWDGEQDEMCASIQSSSIPTYEVKPILPTSLEGLALSMSELAKGDIDKSVAICEDLASHYNDWILKRKDEIKSEVPVQMQPSAELNMAACDECLNRIIEGIKLLQSNTLAQEAFTLMNKAMVMQHEHYQLATDSTLKRKWELTGTKLSPKKQYSAPNYEKSSRQWRPFQLAFVLMTMKSIVLEQEQDLDERDIVDLIWFPTGGGKTEAYLGLAAFTIFFRRLKKPENAGTTALMRYTLRLLTTQQFQRAASLICAAEKIRRDTPKELGQEAITIGLWVGGSVTPNSEKAAIALFNKLTGGDRENPFIILSCPWCGLQMGPVKHGKRTRVKGYTKLLKPDRIRLVCEDPHCEFNHGEGLPLQVIDEHIYSSPPTLVIGTVDKFAMLPWTPNTRSLFGLGQDNIDPPDLVIQDELHLISGPLGSMVGHYETVIDALTERQLFSKAVAAKIVASTATISRADDQVSRLYGGRKSSLFPSQGLRAGDSFFARENTEAEGRLYCGVFATGLPSLTTTQVRVLSSLLQSGKALDIDDPKLLDPYWTLMVYFNSIRELGHAATLIKADIPEYINVIGRRLGLSRLWSEAANDKRRWINEDLELTGRIQNSEITEYMDRLFSPYPGSPDQKPVDVCLATNMIQVGLDVARLSLMAIIGQPKTTSEYIQASSRVGRSQNGPGLVVTILSPSKPRDRSHAEHFRSFHQSIYRYVEPTSVTPFALPVAERALHAIAISLVRHWGDDEQRSNSATPSVELRMRVTETIIKRVEKVEPEETERVRVLLNAFFDEWDRLAPDLYGSFTIKDNVVPMMYPSGTHPDDSWDRRSYPTPSSMRNVDAGCNAFTISHYPE